MKKSGLFGPKYNYKEINGNVYQDSDGKDWLNISIWGKYPDTTNIQIQNINNLNSCVNYILENIDYNNTPLFYNLRKEYSKTKSYCEKIRLLHNQNNDLIAGMYFYEGNANLYDYNTNLAVSNYIKSIKRAKYTSSYFNLAIIFNKKNEYLSSITNFKIIENDLEKKNLRNCYYFMCLNYYKISNYLQSKKYLSNYLKLNDDSDEYLKEKEELLKLKF